MSRVRRGMTLLEVLIALAIASVVFAAVFLIYRAATATAIRQGEGERINYAPAEAFSALQTDMAGLLPAGLDEACAIKLATDAKAAAPRSEFSFCAWRSTAREGLAATVEKITWRVEGEPGRTRLTRAVSALTGPESAVTTTNYFLRGIAAFRLQLHDGNLWRDAWPPDTADQKTPAPPKTLRVELALDADAKNAAWSTDFIIPSSIVVTSRIQRATTAAPPAPRAPARP